MRIIFTGLYLRHVRVTFDPIVTISVVFFILLSFEAKSEENNKKYIDSIVTDTIDIKNFEFSSKNFDPNLKSIASEVINKVKNSKIQDPASCEASLLNQIKANQARIPRGLLDENYLLEGILLESCRKNQEAILSFEKSLKLRRNNSLALYRLAAIFIKEEKLDQALQILKEAEWQEFKDKYLLDFLVGTIYYSQNKKAEAIDKYQKSLKEKPDFLPTAKLLYKSKTELRNATKDSKIAKKLDLEIPSDLELITRLDPNNQKYSLLYIRYLLSTGDPINSPSKLVEGVNLVERWLKLSTNNYTDFALLKIQFLEKQNKTKEMLEFLNSLEKDNKLSNVLRIKKNQLTAAHIQ